ncbi:MAG TPA: alpha/beta fold hydrolase [Actinomycetota bacterium]
MKVAGSLPYGDLRTRPDPRGESLNRSIPRAVRGIARGPIVPALLVAVVAASCTSAGPPPKAAASPVASSSVPAGAASPLRRVPCRDYPSAKCGFVTVPLDRSNAVPGTVQVFFELFPHTDASQPALEPIVAAEGGPGYPTTGSASSYLDLFRPLRPRHDLLLMDDRGTGHSDLIVCRRLQSYVGTFATNAGLCAQQLGDRAPFFDTAQTADDLADVLATLGMTKVDLYGDSYGTFFAQTFAVRHPSLLRSLVLDSSYPVEGLDPWYRDGMRALRSAFEDTCAQQPSCPQGGVDPMTVIGDMAARLRQGPIVGTAYDADGVRHHIRLDTGFLVWILNEGATNPDVYREALPAMQSALAGRPDDAPILRLAAENDFAGGAGSPRDFTEGLYAAVTCHDYPHPFDMGASFSQRAVQYQNSVAMLAKDDPSAFGPFTVQEWTTAPLEEFDYCLNWPNAPHADPPMPPGHSYPKVPTLVMAGALDSLTSSEGGRTVAKRFPDSTFVEVANMTHVTALSDYGHCASVIVVRFVQTLSAGDTSCASAYPPVRSPAAFPVRAADVDGASGSGTAGRAAAIAAGTVGDVMARWWNNYGGAGVGLRGGTFTTTGLVQVGWRLHAIRWVKDVPVSGWIHWNRRTGAASCRVSLSGGGVPPSTLTIRWNAWPADEMATVSGTVGGRHVALRVAPPVSGSTAD